MPDVLQAEMVVFALEAMALGSLVKSRLIATLPGAIGHLSPRLRCGVPGLNTDAVKELGIDGHRS